MTLLASIVLLLLPANLSVLELVGQNLSSGRIYGRVTDLAGNALKGATLKLFIMRSRTVDGIRVPFMAELRQRSITDDQGNYNIESLPRGEYTISVDLRGFRHTEVGVFLQEGTKLLDIGLQLGVNGDIPRMEVVGVVRQADDSLLRDATVTAISTFNRQIVEQGRTDSAGRFAIVLTVPGQYVVFASKPGFVTRATNIASGGRKTVDFTLAQLTN